MTRIMLTKNLCPCCAQTLLRHASCKRIFWFCNSCYQEMPVLSNSFETELARRHWLNNTITDRQHIKEKGGFRQPANSGTCLKPKEDLQRLAYVDNLKQLANSRSRLSALK